MIYSIEELRTRITPVAEKYALRAVYIFGSYARGEATEDSDVDILVDITGSTVLTISWGMGGLFEDMHESVDKEIDLVTTSSLQKPRFEGDEFAKNVRKEAVMIYEQCRLAAN